MTKWHRFWIGGGGALLFILGGVVAALNSDEHRPLKLVQIGIAAPALVASYVNAQAISAPSPIPQPSIHSTAPTGFFNFISPAYGMDIGTQPKRIILAGGFFNDVLQGLSRPLPAIAAQQTNSSVNRALQNAIQNASKSASDAATAAHKAAIAADQAASNPTVKATAAAKQSAMDASVAAQKANSDAKALQDAAKALK